MRKKWYINLGRMRVIWGIIEFNKLKREFTIQASVNDGILSNKAYERWAAEKIAKLMYKEDGIFPKTITVEKLAVFTNFEIVEI